MIERDAKDVDSVSRPVYDRAAALVATTARALVVVVGLLLFPLVLSLHRARVGLRSVLERSKPRETSSENG